MRQFYKDSLLAGALALCAVIGWLAAFSMPAAASSTIDEAEILAAYTSFKTAQNDRDLERVGAHFIDGPDFLWVSDGRSYWGREAVLKRMGRFQGAEVWRVEPNMDSARVVELSPTTAMLNMRLTLVIGSADKPNALPFLVSILFRDVEGVWRIAALLTTNDKTR